MKALFCLIVLAANLAHAETYPSKPVRIIVPFSPGAGTDIFARLVARKLSESLSQPFVVENKVGAAGIIGCELVARAAPDGYTLLMGTTGSHTTNPAVYAKLPYDPLKDFAPITLVAEAPFLLFVHPAVRAKSVKELVALAKAHPGELTFGSSGIGSSSHLGFELFSQMAGIRAIHVPYKGLAPATADTAAGHLTMSVDSVASAGGYIKDGRLRVLGTGGSKRSALLPDVPTIAEAGAEAGLSGFELGSWYALFAPAGTAAESVRLLQRETARALAAADLKEQFAALGAEPVGSTSEALEEVLKRDLAKWRNVARSANVPLQ